MKATLPLSRMTTAEKLSAREALWQDLSRNADKFDSPAWHQDVLREREQGFDESKESYVDLETAKKILSRISAD